MIPKAQSNPTPTKSSRNKKKNVPIIHQPSKSQSINLGNPASQISTKKTKPTVKLRIPGIPASLEDLDELSHLFVKPETESPQLFENTDSPNRFNVFDESGQRIYCASEVCTGFWLGSPDTIFTANIYNFRGNVVLTLRRPPECCGDAEMLVYLWDGTKLGRIHQTSTCSALFDITDSIGRCVLQITDLKGGGGGCGGRSTNYPVTTMDGNRVGIIRKTFAGFLQESFKEEDNFGVEFQKKLNVKWKALMFAAVFLIDYLYFNNSYRHRHGYRYHHDHHSSHPHFGRRRSGSISFGRGFFRREQHHRFIGFGFGDYYDDHHHHGSS